MELTAVALSGGADSALAAHLVAQQRPCLGLFALLSQPNPSREIERVEEICRRLQLSCHVVDLTKPFREKIIHYFINAYRQGLTPNPCMLCNREIKFGLLWEEAQRLGASVMATGHYARVEYNPRLDQHLLYKGLDKGKDQSYFLALLSPKQLSHALFPLGHWQKQEVLKEAIRLGLFTLTAPESQEVCFIKGDYRKLFTDLDFPPGDIITVSGQVVGQHKGLYAYTIGQRRGLGLRLGRPYYVVGLDITHNRLIVGPKKYLYRKEFWAHKLNLLYPLPLQRPFKALVRIRYRHQEAPATVYPEDQTLHIVFDHPQPAITPGQFAVFYRDDLVLGAAEILPQGLLDF